MIVPRRQFLGLTAGALTLGAAHAQDKNYVMKISGPTINDTPHLFMKNYAAAVQRDSGGRIKPEVYPASQLGSIPRQIEGTQFGAIQAANIPPEFFVGVDERFEVMAAPGLVDSMEHGQRLAAAPNALHQVGNLAFGMTPRIARKFLQGRGRAAGIRSIRQQDQSPVSNFPWGRLPVSSLLGSQA